MTATKDFSGPIQVGSRATEPEDLGPGIIYFDTGLNEFRFRSATGFVRALDEEDLSDLINKDGSVTFTADQSMGGNKLTNVALPLLATDAATKAFVEARLSGLDKKHSVLVATDAALAANTPLGTGVGKTLTADMNGALTINGVSVFVDMDNDGGVNDPFDTVNTKASRVLVKNEVAGQHNGIYVVKDKGSGGTPWILVRAIDADEDSEVTANLFVFANQGSVAPSTGWTIITADPIILDTDPIVFSTFSGTAPEGGDAIDVDGNTIHWKPDDSTLEVFADEARVKDGGILDQQIGASAGIDATKLGNGDVDDTELSYLNGTTAPIQGQLDAKLENVEEDLTPTLGGDLALNDKVLTHTANGMRRGSSSTDYLEEQYVHSITLAGSTAVFTTIAALTFQHASFESFEFEYKMKEAITGKVAKGLLEVITNGVDVSFHDSKISSSPLSIEFRAIVSGADVLVQFKNGSANAVTARGDVKRIKI